MQHSFYAAVNHVADLSGNKYDISQVTLLVRDWRISIHFACFCFWMTVTIMIDGSVKRKFGFKLQNSHVIEKRSMIMSIISVFMIMYFGVPTTI